MNRHQPTVSIVVPVYNTARYLDECMHSLLAQTLTDMEIILVDDGSTDRSPSMCDAYAAAHPNVKVIHKANQGLGMARNSGLEAATGRFVAFVDSDDFVSPSTYSTAVRLMERKNLDLVKFTCNRFTDTGDKEPESHDGEPVIYSTPEDIRLLTLCIFDAPRTMERYDIGGSSCMALYRMDLIDRGNIRFKSEREYISEDYLFNLDCYGHASRIGYLPHTLYHYRVTPDSLTQRIDSDSIRRDEAFSRHVAHELISRGYGPESRNYALGYYISRLRTRMKRLFLTSLPMAEKRRWFLQQTSGSYLRDECADYPASGLPLKQRICLYAMRSRNFTLTYALIVGFTRLRHNKFK